MTPEQLNGFREEGFFVWQDCLSSSDVDAARVACDEWDADHEKSLASSIQEGISRVGEIAFTAHLAEKTPTLSRLITLPPFVDIVTTLIGDDVSLYWDQSVYKRPETAREFPWHQDNGYTPIIPDEYVTCWIPLEDVTLDMGPVWVLPKSHTKGPVEHRQTPWGQQCYFGPESGQPVPVQKGSMIVFSSLLFHRSSANVSTKTRRAYIVQYCSAQARHKDTQEPFNRPVVISKGVAVSLRQP